MPSIREQAILELRIDGAGNVVSQLKNVQGATEQTFSKSEQAMSNMEKSMARGFSNMINQYLGFAAAFRTATKVLSEGVEFNKFVENTTMSFSVMMKSADQAQTMMKDLYDFAVNSPLTFKETASSSKQLMAYGFAAEELIPTMKTLGSVAIATGHSLDDISYIYGTLKSQGRAYSRDLMQFGMRGIPIYEELSKVMGVSSDKIQKLASEGKIGFAQVEQAFQNMTTGSGRFAGIIEGYMTTLTGKLSMLSDMAQQSAGTLTSDIMTSLKTFVDNLTKTISDKGFQEYIKELSYSLGGLASGVLAVVSVFIKLLPVLTALLPIVIGFLIVKTIYTAIVALPALLASISASALAMGAGLATTTASMVAMSAAAGEAVISVGLLSEAFVAFAAANPWLLALAAVAAIGGSVIILKHMYEKDALNNKNSKDTETRAAQLASDYFIPEYSLKGMNKKDSIDPSKVADIAAEYKLTEERVAKILELQGMLNKATYDTYMAQKYAREHLGNYGQGGPTIGKSTDQIQAEFLGNLNGKDASVYMPDKTDKDPGAKGYAGAMDYVNGVQRAFDQNKLDWGAYYNKDLAKEAADNALKEIDSAALAGKQIHNLFDQTRYDEVLATARKKWVDFLGGLGTETKAVQQELLPVLATWWTPMVQSAKNTLDAVDDIQISMLQSIEAVDKEYASQVATLNKQANILAAEGGNEDELNRIAQQRIELYATLLGLHKHITTESEKQANLERYKNATQGNQAVSDAAKAQAGADYASGNTASAASAQGVAEATAGTDVGKIMTGANPIAAMVTSLVEMLTSIENVSKLLNFFGTMLEATKAVIEPLLNNALQPMVQILTQIGTVIGQILTPFIGLIKIISVLTYIQLVPLIAILNVLGEAFTWLYDSCVVPLGNYLIYTVNSLIGVVNGVITAINDALGWAGVHIAQVQYIDYLYKTTDALADLGSMITNQKDALNSTIDYLTKKINNAVDEQLSSLQDLYEVGAISGTDYEKQVAALNAQKIATENLDVTAADQALTGQAIYERLYELSGIKQVLEANPNLTQAQVSEILTRAGLNSASQAVLMGNAVAAAMLAYGAAKGTDLTGLVDSMATALTQALVAYSQIASGNTAGASGSGGSGGAPSAPDNNPIVNVISGIVAGGAVAGLPGAIAGAIVTAATGKGIVEVVSGVIDSITGWFAVGTGNVPNDMLANIHKGEGIIPATFMDGIRSGELSLSSGNKGSSGQPLNVYVTVQGSVTSENDLATTVATKIYQQRKLGVLTF